MKRKLGVKIGVVVLGLLLLFTSMLSTATPARALDQYPVWMRDNNNIIYNAYYRNGRLNDIYTANNDFANEIIIRNLTGSTWTIRTKVIPQTGNQLKLRLSGGWPIFAIPYMSPGSSVSCYPASTGGEAWGCQIVIPDNGTVEIDAQTYYTGVHSGSVEQYQTQYLMYNDTYTQVLAGINVYVNLH